MKVLKSFIFSTAFVVLLGCEQQDGKTGNTALSATDNNLAAQSRSDDSPVSNAVDSKAVIPTPGSVALFSTNQQSQENQAGVSSYGELNVISFHNGGYVFEDISLTNFSLVEEGGISLP